MNGKSGTITPEEFDELSSLVTTYGAKLLTKKIAKISTKSAAPFLHENPDSMVGKAWSGVASRINSVVTGVGERAINKDAYSFLSSLVSKYGAEVVVWKLSKIASKTNNKTDSTLLKSVFPRASVKKAS